MVIECFCKKKVKRMRYRRDPKRLFMRCAEKKCTYMRWVIEESDPIPRSPTKEFRSEQSDNWLKFITKVKGNQ